MSISKELFEIADKLQDLSDILQDKDFNIPLQRLVNAAEAVGKAWSGSWLGYHSRVYYKDLSAPPPGARFSQEWGMMDELTIQGTIGEWREYRFEDVVSTIEKIAGNPDIHLQRERAVSVAEEFEEAQAEVTSLLSGALVNRKDDEFLIDLTEKVKNLKILGVSEIIEGLSPKAQIMSRDMYAINEGLRTPPHLSVLASVLAIRAPFTKCKELSKLSRRAASHLQNVEKHNMQSERIGTNVFIGHGRSSVWKDLKDFIQDRMHLQWDEFNRVPVAGITNIARLSQMLDEAAIAFLIMTAEDEQADGRQHARQNVIHEAGLFQGRLGFERAIILLEEGCEEFSNIQGLGEIRFPKGNISAVFEDIRRVLEREGLVEE